MPSFENPLEAYKQQVADRVMGLEEMQNHIHRLNLNLTQCKWDAPLSPYVQQGVREAVRAIVGALVDKASVAIDPKAPDFRDQIVEKADDLWRGLEGSPIMEKAKSDLRTGFIRAIGIDDPMARVALIRYFDIAFALFFTITAQSALYVINKINIIHMRPTEEESAEIQRRQAREFAEKGGQVIVAKEDEEPEKIIKEILGKSEDKD
jgi:hypothetical protein